MADILHQADIFKFCIKIKVSLKFVSSAPIHHKGTIILMG